MKFSEVKQSITAQFSVPNGHRTTFFIMGQPGGGKSACARSALAELGFTEAGGNMVEFTASTRDPVDVLGTPDNTGEFTRWTPPEEFYKLRAGTGPKALLLEELSDAPTPMQNALCQVIHDHRAGNLLLTDQLFIVATGNRTEDKSGANRITSKLAGRTRRLDFTEDLHELRDYALEAGWPIELIQFLAFRPGLVAEFDPNRFANPTPRTWEDVARVPTSLPEALQFDNIKGAVGEGAASEYIGFRKIFSQLPDIEGILLAPDTAPVPEDLAAKYAVMGAIAKRATKDNIDRIMRYTARFEREFDIMSMKDMIKLTPAVKSTRAFIEWASRNAEYLM